MKESQPRRDGEYGAGCTPGMRFIIALLVAGAIAYARLESGVGEVEVLGSGVITFIILLFILWAVSPLFRRKSE